MLEKKQNITSVNKVEQPVPLYGFMSKSEEERLIEDIYRPDIEKLRLFTRMLRNNASLKKAKITHKQ